MRLAQSEAAEEGREDGGRPEDAAEVGRGGGWPGRGGMEKAARGSGAVAAPEAVGSSLSRLGPHGRPNAGRGESFCASGLCMWEH